MSNREDERRDQTLGTQPEVGNMEVTEESDEGQDMDMDKDGISGREEEGL